MSVWNRSPRAFASLEKAWRAFPHVGGAFRVLVFNRQGQPVVQYSRAEGQSLEIDQRECALGTELARTVFNGVKAFAGGEPRRAAFFYEDQVLTIDEHDPFILLVFWPLGAVRLDERIEGYLQRLTLTLLEELT